jgi:LPXTG-motif cell wall-anchored protein
MKSPLKMLTRGAAAGLALLVVMVAYAPPSLAAPSVTVSKTSGLSDGESITVTGSGFAPNMASIAVGQCKKGYTGPTDCNLQGGATFRTADASGKIATVTLKVATTFGGTDCTKVECVIGVAPLPTNATPAEVTANSADIPITFGAAGAVAGTDTETDTTDTATETDTADAAADLPKTGPTDSLPVILIGGSALILTGAGLLVLMPRRRRLELR